MFLGFVVVPLVEPGFELRKLKGFCVTLVGRFYRLGASGLYTGWQDLTADCLRFKEDLGLGGCYQIVLLGFLLFERYFFGQFCDNHFFVV